MEGRGLEGDGCLMEGRGLEGDGCLMEGRGEEGDGCLMEGRGVGRWWMFKGEEVGRKVKDV